MRDATAVPATSPGSSSTAAPHRIKRLDGIRAVAVLLVFAGHAGLANGWEGVHLFFVLSGFLITAVLRRARHDRSFWRPFYIKRATRILPPLLLCLLIGYLLYTPPLWVLALYGLFAANIMQLTSHHIDGGLVVLWSLSVEEHFYLLWPFAVRFLSRRHLLILCTALLVCEPIARLLAAMHYQDANVIYMLTPFQLDGLLAGSILSLLWEIDSSRDAVARASRPLAIALLTIYVALSVFWKAFSLESNSLIFKSLGYSLVAFTAASIIATVYSHPRSVVSRLLASWPMVLLGTISYGCYLFHLEMIGLALRISQRIYGHPRGILAIPVGIAAAIVFSWVSFHLYEHPIVLWGRRRAQRYSGRPSAPIPSL